LVSAATGTAARPIALVTGVGRLRGIASAIVLALGEDGWDVAAVYSSAYDARMHWGADDDCQATLTARLAGLGRRYVPIECDVADADAPGRVFDEVEGALGPAQALVVAHTESVDSGLLDTSVESFDRHYNVNVRGTWLLIKEFGRRFRSKPGTGRVITLTSDHVVGNVPYGATKAAADRITTAAAYELGPLGITANTINPGPVDTGWMNDDHRAHALSQTPLARVGTPEDAANIVRFLCSPRGGWINGQLIYSNGGFRSSIG
jgi:3-oxoacyl-[acyl-carrier protein] reductase